MAPETLTIGRHRLQVEEDIVFLIQEGDFLLDDAIKVHEQIEQMLARTGRAFVMVNQSRAGETRPDVRRFMAEWNQKHKASGAVVFGGGVVGRAVASLALSAIQIFRPSSLLTVMAKTEEEARAWIAEQRAKLPK